MTNLLTTLQADKVDQAELQSLLLNRFGSASQTSEHEMVISDREGNIPVMTLHYTKKFKLQRIERYPHLTDAKVTELRTEIEKALLAPSTMKIARVVAFSPVRVTGAYRWQDALQIVPVPAGAPQLPSHMWGDHPFLLEVAFTSSSDTTIMIERRQNALNRTLVELFPLINPGFSSDPPSALHEWVYATAVGAITSEYRQRGYVYQDFKGISDSFTDISNLPAIPSVDFNTYYSRIGISATEGLDLPDTLSGNLDRIAKLNDDDRQRYQHAGYWLQHSQRAWRSSHSAAFTALVSAIEALLDEPSSEKCPSCRSTIGGGSTAQFREFLRQHLPGDGATDAARNELYRLRSKIAHGDRLFYSDRFGFGFHPERNSEDAKLRNLTQSARVVVYNWLQSRSLTTP